MNVEYLLWLLLLGAITWFWVDSLRARETAVRVCANACRQYSLQLLDQTVAVERLGFCRLPGGRLCLQRRYTFEFNTGGDERLRGTLTLRDRQVVFLDLPGYYERVVAGG